MEKRIWTGRSGRLYLELTEEQITLICTSGGNDAAVAEVCGEKGIRQQLDAIPSKEKTAALRGFGDWDDFSGEAENNERLLWVAAWDIFDETEV